MARGVRQIRGRITYRHGALETGHELFSVSVLPDGARTMRCECHFDTEALLRDVVFTLDAAWRPVDAYLRVTRASELLGAGWYHFADTGTTCHALNAQQQPEQIVLRSATRAPACGFHPILNDDMWSALFDLTRPSVKQTLTGCVTYSTQQIGNAGIGVENFDLELRYCGMESVSVPAGTFECRHVEALIRGLAAPFKLWTWSDDYIIVKETWAEMPGQSFELDALQVS